MSMQEYSYEQFLRIINICEESSIGKIIGTEVIFSGRRLCPRRDESNKQFAIWIKSGKLIMAE